MGLPKDSVRIIHDICEINGHKNLSVLIQESSFIEYEYIYNEYEETLPNGKVVRILHRPDLEIDDFITAKMNISDGYYFVMGDKRSDSYDSRYFGSIPADQILGKVVKIIPADE